MEYTDCDLDLHNGRFADELNPNKLFNFAGESSMNLPDTFFALGANFGEGLKETKECYSKNILYFSELSDSADEAEYENSGSLSGQPDDSHKSYYNDLSYCTVNPNSISKSVAPAKTLASVQVDQASVISEPSVACPLTQNADKESELNSSIGKKTKSKPKILNDVQSSTKSNLESQNNDESQNSGKEEDLIFLVRRVDRKTNKSTLLTKHRKRITKCPHKTQEYYAKGMCKNCYHNKGSRSKKASKCEHTERDHYAKGLCKNCYLHFFHIKKKNKIRRASHDTCDSPNMN